MKAAITRPILPNTNFSTLDTYLHTTVKMTDESSPPWNVSPVMVREPEREIVHMGFDKDPVTGKLSQTSLSFTTIQRYPVKSYTQVPNINQKSLPVPNSSQKDSPDCNQEDQLDPTQEDDPDCSLESVEEKDLSTNQEKAPDTQEEPSTMTFRILRNRDVPLDPK